MPPTVCKGVCTIALRGMLPYIPLVELELHVMLLSYRGKISGWIFLMKSSDAANLDVLNLFLLFEGSKQLGSKVFLSNVIA